MRNLRNLVTTPIVAWLKIVAGSTNMLDFEGFRLVVESLGSNYYNPEDKKESSSATKYLHSSGARALLLEQAD